MFLFVLRGFFWLFVFLGLFCFGGFCWFACLFCLGFFVPFFVLFLRKKKDEDYLQLTATLLTPDSNMQDVNHDKDIFNSGLFV